jgi:alpha-D-ribose 1-methylphosphonate 5-triphosphate synthase subunit PhnG
MSARINYDGREFVPAAMLDRLWQREMQQDNTYADIIRQMDDEWQARQDELYRQRDAMLLREMAG